MYSGWETIQRGLVATATLELLFKNRKNHFQLSETFKNVKTLDELWTSNIAQKILEHFVSDKSDIGADPKSFGHINMFLRPFIGLNILVMPEMKKLDLYKKIFMSGDDQYRQTRLMFPPDRYHTTFETVWDPGTCCAVQIEGDQETKEFLSATTVSPLDQHSHG